MRSKIQGDTREMRRIFKYPLKVIDKQSIMMPKGAQILCVQRQDHGDGLEGPCIWALVAEGVDPENRTFLTIGTDHPIGKTLGKYIGSYQLRDGAFVGHVFEVEHDS